MSDLEKAVEELRKAKFVLVHDSEKRENETDMVIAAEYVKSADVARMRMDAGGLVCIALGREIVDRLALPFLSDIYPLAEGKYVILEYLEAKKLQYDKHSAFSVSINHRNTYTGITDADRALTISELGKFCRKTAKETNKYRLQKEFGKNFRSEGHVPLLISSGIDNRQGHTELATALMSCAGLAPAAAICEMLDHRTGRALSSENAREYAKKNSLAYLEGKDIIEAYGKEKSTTSA